MRFGECLAGKRQHAWGRVTAFLLTGQTTEDALAMLARAWKDLLEPCTHVVPENRPDVIAVRDRLAKIVCES